MEKFSNRKTISEYIGKHGGWSKTPDFDCFCIRSVEFVEETNFGQLMISLSNDTENPL